MINVNLLPPKHVFTQKEREIRKKILTFMIVFSGIFLVVFGVVLGGNFYYAKRLAGYDEEQKKYQDQLSELSQMGWNVSSIGFKAAGVKFIKASQHPFAEPITNIKDLAGNLVSISRVDLSPNYEVVMSGSAKSKADLETFLNKFTQSDPQTKFLRGVTLKDLQQRESQQFGFSISGKYLPPNKN